MCISTMARFIVNSFRTTQINISSRKTTKPTWHRVLYLTEMHFAKLQNTFTSKRTRRTWCIYLGRSIRFVFSLYAARSPSRTKIEIIYDLRFVSFFFGCTRVYYSSCESCLYFALAAAELRGRRLKNNTRWDILVWREQNGGTEKGTLWGQFNTLANKMQSYIKRYSTIFRKIHIKFCFI